MSWNQKKLCVGVWEFHEALCIPDALSKYSLSLWCFLPLICTFQEDLVPSLLLGKSSPWVLLPCICSPSEPFLRFALDSESATSKPCCVRDGCGCVRVEALQGAGLCIPLCPMATWSWGGAWGALAAQGGER